MNSLDVAVLCKKRCFSLGLTHVQLIEIGGISFISCGGVELLNVGTLTIDRSNFISQHFSWSVDNVTNATITTTSFIHGQIGPILVVTHSSLLIKSSTFINTTITDNNKRIGDPCEGAAIYCTESSLNVVQAISLKME